MARLAATHLLALAMVAICSCGASKPGNQEPARHMVIGFIQRGALRYAAAAITGVIALILSLPQAQALLKFGSITYQRSAWASFFCCSSKAASTWSDESRRGQPAWSRGHEPSARRSM